MTRTARYTLCSTVLLAVWLWSASGTARAQSRTADTPDAQAEESARLAALAAAERAALQELLNAQTPSPLTWRFGVGLHGLINSKQGRPLIYPDLGARYESERLFVALHVPGAVAGVDLGAMLIRQRLLRRPGAEPVLLAINTTPQLVQAEIAALRIGQLWDVRLGADPKKDREGLPVQLAAGIVGVADWAIMEARLLSEPIDEETSLGSIIITDPLVIGLGVFGAVRQERGAFKAELSLSVARDMFQWEQYSRLTGFIIAPEIDVHFTLFKGFGVYTRGRLATYTHVKNPRAFSAQNQFGVALNF